MTAAAGPELEELVEAVVRAVLARHRAAGPVRAEAVAADAVRALRPVLAVLAEPAVARPAAANGSRVVVERDVLEAEATGRLVLPRGAIVTPLARDTAAERGVELVLERG